MNLFGVPALAGPVHLRARDRLKPGLQTPCNTEFAAAGIVEVPEEQIKEAVRLLFTLANLKSEPTGALAIGALLTDPGSFRDRRVCCVISGGNVDPEVYRAILAS